MRHVLAACLLVLTAVTSAAAQPAVFLVRHAERASSGGTPAGGPELTPEGKARAASLAKMLNDAKITTIFTSELTRTKQTAQPLADALKITPTVVPAADTPALVKQIRAAKGNVLVVGHSNTVPEILKALGVSESVTIADSEFDNLFVVIAATPPKFVRLRYR